MPVYSALYTPTDESGVVLGTFMHNKIEHAVFEFTHGQISASMNGGISVVQAADVHITQYEVDLPKCWGNINLEFGALFESVNQFGVFKVLDLCYATDGELVYIGYNEEDRFYIAERSENVDAVVVIES